MSVSGDAIIARYSRFHRCSDQEALDRVCQRYVIIHRQRQRPLNDLRIVSTTVRETMFEHHIYGNLSVQDYYLRKYNISLNPEEKMVYESGSPQSWIPLSQLRCILYEEWVLENENI